MPDEKGHSDDAKLRALEETLREIPAPPVPEGLQKRLVAAIPERVHGADRRRWRVLRLSVAAAILVGAVLVGAFMLLNRTGEVKAGLLDNTSAHLMQTQATVMKETKPCDMLPPLQLEQS